MKNLLRERLRQPWFGGAVGTALTAACGLCLLLSPFGKALRDWSYDLLFLVRPAKSIDDVVIVALDEQTYKSLGQAPADFSRTNYARLLDILKANGAKMVVFDVLFIDHRKCDPDDDPILAKAMRDFGAVVVGSHWAMNVDAPHEVWPPLPIFTNAAAGSGIVEIDAEADTESRRDHPGTKEAPSLSWKAAELAGASVTRVPENQAKERWLNYYRDAPFDEVSFGEIVSGRPLGQGAVKDKVVFVGSAKIANYAGDRGEDHRYPWTWWAGDTCLGVELHAIMFSNLMRGDWLWWPGYGASAALLLGTGILFGYGLTLFRPISATAVAVAAALVIAGLVWLASVLLNMWFPWAIVVAAQIPVALGWSYLFDSIKSYIETKLLERSLALYLSPSQVKRIIKRPDLLKPGAEQKEISVLFSDIANFSKVSEIKDPHDLVELLNRYYEAALQAIHSTEGTVLDLMGDAIFAIWNAPVDQPDHQQRACEAALSLSKQLVLFDSTHGDLPLRTRIGLHTCTACVGNIGSSTHFDYTAIGKDVNLASRLEGLNKQLGTTILATRGIQKTTEGRFVSRLVGHFKFYGMEQRAEVYELLDRAESEAESLPWRKAFADALQKFQRRAFAEAESGFQNVLRLRPNDGPAEFYLARLPQLRSAALPADWMGEIELGEK
jgi:adenylate cyclase